MREETRAGGQVFAVLEERLRARPPGKKSCKLPPVEGSVATELWLSCKGLQ
jgi:hypothetical protein